MKLRNSHLFYNGLCSGCNAAVKQKDVDPDKIYQGWLCGRCQAELEELPPRYQVVFDRLKREMNKVGGQVEFLNNRIKMLEEYMVANDLNPQEAGYRKIE